MFTYHHVNAGQVRDAVRASPGILANRKKLNSFLPFTDRILLAPQAGVVQRKNLLK